mmetsp:Transcript_31643/g.51198  ORF Transcript_31643/g.51198 Transcript_31643/m.51198 type:complete len:269 (-) Transcript_31643:25-831(-)
MAFKPNATLKNVLITGYPGVGKTTCVRKVVQALNDKQNNYSSIIALNGFYSLERRQKSQSAGAYRIGFDVISVVDETSGILARTEQELPSAVYNKYTMGQSTFHHVGKYIVDLEGFERFVLPLLQSKHNNGGSNKQAIFVIDEIGKMELFSRPFQNYTQRLLDDPSVIVIATVPNKHNIAFVDRVKQRPDAKLFTLTQNNRDLTTKYITHCVFEIIDTKMSQIKSGAPHDKGQRNRNEYDDDSKSAVKSTNYYNAAQSKTYRKKGGNK